MYGRLPFDRPETIVELGEGLLRRIDDQREREVIRQYLATVGAESSAGTP